MKFRAISCALLSLALAQFLSAGTTPAPRSDALPDNFVQSDDGKASRLNDLLKSTGDGPVLFLPLFTRCTSSCPTLLHKLETALTGDAPPSHVRVLIFSFDPTETPATLSAFRAASRIPAKWVLARADEDATRALLQYLNYPVMTRGAVLIHPSELFVLDNSLRWRWTLSGVDWTSGDLSRAVERSASPNFVSRVEEHTQGIAWLALGFALVGIFLVVAFWSRRWPTRSSVLCSPRTRHSA